MYSYNQFYIRRIFKPKGFIIGIYEIMYRHSTKTKYFLYEMYSRNIKIMSCHILSHLKTKHVLPKNAVGINNTKY